jgi:hypothetical protein
MRLKTLKPAGYGSKNLGDDRLTRDGFRGTMGNVRPLIRLVYLNDIGTMIMGRFKITQGIIEKGIEKKKKELEGLKSFPGKNSFLSGQPETVFFDDLNKEEAGKITPGKLKKDSRFEYMKAIQKAIYIVSAPDFPYSWEEINDDKGEFKKLKKTKTTALPRISDKSHWDYQEGKKPKCLYVGSSHDIAGRVIKHFWKCAKDTYSLHLIEWEWWDEKNKVQIAVWDASKITSDVHLQIIEDIVWDKYKPLFGREGAK